MNTPESLLKDAQQIDTTRFDYIIVGSGPGGGPLACRLALAGKRVLLIEAGGDPVKTKPSPAYPDAAIGETTSVPCYYAAASEDGELSWMFSVRHYEDDAWQELDEKYNSTPFDPNRPPGTSHSLDPKYLDPHPRGGKQGVFYPRSSGIGGCTSHHAMIMIAPNGKDWNYIADLTGDDSWQADRMRPYFAKMERCLYIDAYDRFLRNLLGIFYKIWRWLVLLFDPRAFVDKGGHGFKGWQPTSFIDPYLVNTIRKNDQPFFKVILRAALGVLHNNSSLIARLKAALLRLRVVQHIDFNDINTRRASPEGVFLIPIGTQSEASAEDQTQTLGSRSGLREFLMRTAKERPNNLVIATGVHVTRVLFEKGGDGEPPRAVGIEGVRGDHLYEASPVQKPVPANAVVRYFTRGEVVLSGGSFNTPQLLMLSGIGDRTHLAEHGIHYLFGEDGKPLKKGLTDENWDGLEAPVINLPGVGRNMQDRYEVTVVSELNKEFSTLNGVSFKPGDLNDPARDTWLSGNKGLYATNGGTLAVIRRSAALSDDEREPDLFTFGAPAAFRGYYWNWSRELFKSRLGGSGPDAHNLWSWVILKAYTHNNGGTVRLRTASPFDMPEICFHSFEETSGDGWKKDLAAMVDAVRFMRRINARNPKQFVREIQPGADIADGSPEMEHWIKTQAWGHHACGTCRIGADSWQADPENLNDRRAVLDSHFRVHGVRGLRVVDASVFPKIPGYFILGAIFMLSEKAADTLLQDSIPSITPARKPKKEVRDEPVRSGWPDTDEARAEAFEGLPAEIETGTPQVATDAEVAEYAGDAAEDTEYAMGDTAEVARYTIADGAEVTDCAIAHENEVPDYVAADEDEVTEYAIAHEDEVPDYVAADDDEIADYVAADEDELVAYVAADEDELVAYVAADEDELADYVAAHEDEFDENLDAIDGATVIAASQPTYYKVFYRTRKHLAEKFDSLRKAGVVWRQPKRKALTMRRFRIWFSPRMWKKERLSTYRIKSRRLSTPIQEKQWTVSSQPEPSGTAKGWKMSTITTHSHRPAQCFDGSTDFYATPKTDQFTPSYLEAQPLAQSVAHRWENGELPPWIQKGEMTKSPAEQYVEWFNGIWHTGDPSQWNRDVFTNTATTIDPSGITRGADEAAANFRLLFKFFPALRGEVVSWAANDREIFINWRFRIPNTRDRLPIGPITQFLHDQNAGRDFLVPVVDKFCFVEGRVSYRLATFDIITLIGYLSDNYGKDELYDFLIAYFWQALYSGGIPLLPRMLINLALGLFYWQPLPPQGLYADPGDGFVRLKWDPDKDAVAYKVTRAMAISGNYVSPLPSGKDLLIERPTTEPPTTEPPPTTYVDRDVINGTPYWYLVSPIYKKWEATPVSKDAKIFRHPQKRTEQAT